MNVVRISITVPPPLVTAADRRARELDRSRSWVVAEALRLYLADAEETSARPRTGLVREPGGAALVPGLGYYRSAQLEADLALTPEQRVKEAEEGLSEFGGRAWRGHRLVMFDRYEDYLAWQRWADLAPP